MRSDRPQRRSSPLACAAVAAVAFLAASESAGGIGRDEALAAAYPGATFRAERIFLTAAQQEAVAAQAKTPVPTALIARYLAVADGQVVGRAYVDTHVVRTKKQSLLISLDAAGAVKRVDVTAFLEPAEYETPSPWLDQYRRRTLSDDLQVQRAIRPIAGATLSARSTNEAVRRVLAIDRVLAAAPVAPGSR
jgi:hypothetical protein